MAPVWPGWWQGRQRTKPPMERESRLLSTTWKQADTDARILALGDKLSNLLSKPRDYLLMGNQVFGGLT